MKVNVKNQFFVIVFCFGCNFLYSQQIIRNGYFCSQYSNIFMSSPVTGQAIGDTYTGGTSIPAQAYRQYKWNTATQAYELIPETEVMIPGIGYIETTGGNGNFGQNLANVEYKQTYTGAQNNGIITVPIVGNNKLNLLGNPYPDYLDLDSFILDPVNLNIVGGSIYLWTHNTNASSSNPGASQINFSTSDYAIYNIMGGVRAGRNNVSGANTNNTNNSYIPNGKLQFGTGFFIAGTGGGLAQFTNAMRIAGLPLPDQQSFKNNSVQALITPPSRSRIWISLEQGSGTVVNSPLKQTLIGYATGATDAATDRNFDSPAISPIANSILDIYSVTPTGSTKLAIQGKNLLSSFNVNDFFQLGFSASAGQYTFTSIGDGLFNGGQGAIQYFIYDASNNSVNSLPYTFTLSASETNNVTRFRVVFKAKLMQITNQCGTTVPSFDTQIFSNFIGGTPTGVTITYVYKITNSAGNSFNAYHILDDRTLSNIFYGLNPSPLFFNSTYTIQVAAIINGVQQPFSSETCLITTPIPPPTSLQSVCGTSLPSFGSLIYANAAQSSIGAKGYKWRVQRMDTFQIGIIQTVLRNLNLNLITNILPSTSPNFVQANKQYCVEVAIVYNGDIISAYSPVCCFNTGLSKMNLTSNNVFENNNFAIAYPNPFSNNFNLKLETVNNEAVEVKVFDMFGKLVTSYNVIDSDIEKLEIGNNYKTGIYNIVISSSDNVYTQRIIKR